MIEINNLNKKFHKNEVLKNLNIKIEKGESAVVIGRSGTGKSVLLKCLLGLIKPDSGIIKIGDKNILGKNLQYINNKSVKIGMPYVEGSQVEAEVLKQGRGDKIKIIKFNRRKHYKKTQGHRQLFTEVKITGIKA